MAAYQKFDCFAYDVEEGLHVFGSHSYFVALLTAVPTGSETVIGDLTQVANGNGYTTGGAATTISTTESGGVKTIMGTQVTTTASGGPISNVRAMALYNATNNRLVMFADYGSPVTVANGKFFRVRFNGTSPGVIHTLS